MRLIDADALQELIAQMRIGELLSEWEYETLSKMVTMQATVDRNHGKWEMKPDPYGFFDEIPVCSVCGCTTEIRKTYAYCPHCGAKMEGAEHEID